MKEWGGRVNISYEIERLIQYGLYKGLINEYDVIYTRNRILEFLNLNEIDEVRVEGEKLESSKPILENIMSWALRNGVLVSEDITYKDLFDARLMACITPKPSEVINKFNELYDIDRALATDYYYNLSKNTNYIRIDRIEQDLKWTTSTPYGCLDITINLSKPEKDPKAIAAAKTISSFIYPKCLLCKENEGYAGRINHPGRGNHRIIPLTLKQESWYFQYSPYSYYNEHCIVLKGKHEPMRISKETFKRLMDFVEQFPHYFIGSNADLPIVGGSILSHDHFQGGKYEFAMANAEIEKNFTTEGILGVTVGRVKWPMSVIRIEGKDKNDVVKAAEYIREKWDNYSDEAVGLISQSNGIPHNTVTPIARMKNKKFQMDLTLRNNRTSEEYPDGIFHPHRELHHIKKENIGLIEVMGLAVLPARLNRELKKLEKYLIDRDKIDEIDKDEELIKHRSWCIELLNKYSSICPSDVDGIIKREVGLVFLKVLEDCGVFKRNEKGEAAFDRFMNSL
ncbi:MAG: galactose-phosphate uridylyltransferase [Clostridiales bacterium]|nr:galactose-phosphate uridylyltransferase [Clostridiales bacterium]